MSGVVELVERLSHMAVDVTSFVPNCGVNHSVRCEG